MTDGALCGPPPLSSARISLRARLHPGFGMLRLLQDGKEIEVVVAIKGGGPSLQHFENRASLAPEAVWTLEVDGPMGCYELTRTGRNYWSVTKTGGGFA